MGLIPLRAFLRKHGPIALYTSIVIYHLEANTSCAGMALAISTPVQASQFGPEVIIDDPWGRELAERHDLSFYGKL